MKQKNKKHNSILLKCVCKNNTIQDDSNNWKLWLEYRKWYFIYYCCPRTCCTQKGGKEAAQVLSKWALIETHYNKWLQSDHNQEPLYSLGLSWYMQYIRPLKSPDLSSSNRPPEALRPSFPYFTHIFAHCPTWLYWLFQTLSVYFLFDFYLFLVDFSLWTSFSGFDLCLPQ